MQQFVGIDLGTTNSAIASFDGDEIRIWKSPEQNDVTPSAILFDKRGNKHVGLRAYNSAPLNGNNVAVLFKRFMGTSTSIEIAATGERLSPEACSAEILRLLHGYLSEDVRAEVDGTVITVPAAFNQMQKSATMQAADLAQLGRVALMQEPVAAVMTVMRTHSANGVFVVYDLGGGTLDVAVAEARNGRVNLLANGGIAMCGGRDFDRLVVDNVVKPWLSETFDLPENLAAHPEYQTLLKVAAWSVEKAKIELSARGSATISAAEHDTRSQDLGGSDIYLEIPLERATFDRLIEERILESVAAARGVLKQAGLEAHDVERLVFVGGPTHYKPLRDRVAFELGLPAKDTGAVNPMTAVAEGAAVFAESIDWQDVGRGRKSTRGRIEAAAGGSLSFNYQSRTPERRAKIVVQLAGELAGEFQIDDLQSGWSSGRLPLRHGAVVDVELTKPRENRFRARAFDPTGAPIASVADEIVITRTAATVDAIPASQSIGIEVLERLGGAVGISWLVRAGDQLPYRGRAVFKAAETLRAGSPRSLKFKLYEGESDRPEDNRFIGVMEITGKDFDDGVISAGAELVCDFEMLDSGHIVLEVSVQDIGNRFHSNRNFYSRQDGQIDLSEAAHRVIDERERVADRLQNMANAVEDGRIDLACAQLERANIDVDERDPERVNEALNAIHETKRLLVQVRAEHLQSIRTGELARAVAAFDDWARGLAQPHEINAFDNLARTMRRGIESNSRDFENQLGELRGRTFQVLWRQDGFVVDSFRQFSSAGYRFAEQALYRRLMDEGEEALATDDMAKLREVVVELYRNTSDGGSEADLLEVTNIVRG